MIELIQDFLTREEADGLFAYIQTRPTERGITKPWGNIERKIHYGTWSPLKTMHRYGPPLPIGELPDELKPLTEKIAAFAGKTINYVSCLGYENEKDHITGHQHDEDREYYGVPNPDMTVWALSLGQVREAVFYPIGCKDKSQYEYIYPPHGSLYVIPHEYNNTHHHAVFDQKFPCALRVCINVKHIMSPPPGYTEEKILDEARKTAKKYKSVKVVKPRTPNPGCTHSAGWRDGTTCVQCGLVRGGKYVEYTPTKRCLCGLVLSDHHLRNTHGVTSLRQLKEQMMAATGPRVYDVHSGNEYPADGVYVGRLNNRGKTKWPDTVFGNYLVRHRNTPEYYRAYAIERMASDPKFREAVESLRGKNLLCWDSGTGHCGVLLELANKGVQS